MDSEVAYLMSQYVEQAQPYCDEEVFAAMLFVPSGIAKAGVLRGLFGGPVGSLARKRAITTSGGLPRQFWLAIGATKTYVLAAEYRRGQAELSGPVHVWRRDDLVVLGNPSGLFGKIELSVKSSGEHFRLESTGKTGSFKKMFNAIRALLENPTDLGRAA